MISTVDCASEWNTHLSLPDDAVDEVGVSVELVLDHVVKHLQQEKHQVMISRR